jgi:hypothetical protein
LCCGTEFGNDDEEHSLEELRLNWINNGTKWFYEDPPVGWNPWAQLVEGGRPDLVPNVLYNFPQAEYNETNSVRNPMVLEGCCIG